MKIAPGCAVNCDIKSFVGNLQIANHLKSVLDCHAFSEATVDLEGAALHATTPRPPMARLSGVSGRDRRVVA